MPAGDAVRRTPVGDGHRRRAGVVTGPVPEIFPGPLLPNVLERSITPAGIQALLAPRRRARPARRRRRTPATTRSPTPPDTVVDDHRRRTTSRTRPTRSGSTPRPTRPAPTWPSSSPRWPTCRRPSAPTELGPEQPFASRQYLIRASPVDPATLSMDVEPTIVDVAGRRAGAPRRRRGVRRGAGRRGRRPVRRRHHADVLHRGRRHLPGRGQPSAPGRTC